MPDETCLTAVPENFKTAYCRRFKCSPAAFERRLFWRCLPLRAWPTALLLRLFSPSFFNADLEFLQNVGACRNPSEAVNEANSLSSDPALNEGILRTPLGLRLSGRRLVRTAHQIWPPTVRPTWTPAATDLEAARFVVPTPKVPQAPRPDRSVGQPPPQPQPQTKLQPKPRSDSPTPLNAPVPLEALLERKAGPPRKRSPYNPAGARSRKQ
jgi:hypothetical protein